MRNPVPDPLRSRLRSDAVRAADGAPAHWLRNAPLAPYSSYRTGGTARWLTSPGTVDDFVEALAFARDRGWPWLVIGGGSNTLIADGRFEGVVIATDAWSERTVTDDGRLVARSGTSLRSLIGASIARGYGGLEGFIGIPGTIGGAVWGNAGGASGGIAPLVESLTVVEPDGEVREVRGEDLPWEYRYSGLGDRTVLDVTLRLRPGADPVALRARAMEVFDRKRATQPLNARSGGCVFRNPPGASAGSLIEAAGLKGTRIGGATVSERHANFIVNEGSATSAEIEHLIEEVRGTVERTFGVRLEREIIVANARAGRPARGHELPRSS